MKVCAHINYGPHQNGHQRFDTVARAVDYFRREVADNPYRHGSTEESDGCYVMDLYPEADENGEPCGCDSAMNFHDYPMTRYSVGPRGGVQRQTP